MGRHVHATPTGHWWPAARIAGKVVAALVSLLLTVGFWYGWKNYHDLDNGLQRLRIVGLGPDRDTTTTPTPGVHGTDENLLIVGNDDRTDMTDAEVKALHTGRDGGSINTDTMMIVHIPADGSKATLISLPRDSYVDIPGFRKNKLNAAYPDGYYNNVPAGASNDQRRAAGATQLVKTIKLLTGLEIDHFLQVDLIGFYRISEAIGPVDVDMCEPVNDAASGLHLHAGRNSLVGRSALAFVRARETIPGGDLGRVQHQRYFLTAAFRDIASAGTLLNPGKLHNLINAVDKSIYVDDSGLSILNLAEQMADLSANNIIGKTIPIQHEEVLDGVGDVLIVDPAKVKRFVTGLINGPAGTPAPSGSSSSGPASSTPPPASTSTSTSKAPIDAGCIH